MTTENNATINEAINNTTEMKGEHIMTNEEKLNRYFENTEKEAYDLCNEYDHDMVTLHGCATAIKESFDHKTLPRNLLRQLPEWDEEKQMAIFKRDVVRGIDRGTCRDFFAWARDAVYESLMRNVEIDIDERSTLLDKVNNFTYYIARNLSQYMENETVDFVNNMFPELKIHYGAKTSRVVNKVLTRIYNLQDYEEMSPVMLRNANNEPQRDIWGQVMYENKMTKRYNSKFAEFADSVNPFKIKRWLIFSLNFIDYLTCSFGNSWGSCHTIDHRNKRNCPETYQGMYMGGTLSYANDYVTIVVYTVDEKYAPTTRDTMWNGNWYGGFETQDKINRQMIHFRGDVMIQGRLYPQVKDGDRDIYKEFREIEERVIADCLGRPNLWKYTRGTEENSKWCQTHDCAHNYQDYFEYSDTGSCILKGLDGEYKGNDYIFTIGAPGIDLDTGYEIGADSDFNGVLTESEVRCCAECGCTLNSEDAIYYDGNYYCSSCCFWCDHHQQWEPESIEHEYVSGWGDLCENAIDELINDGDLYRCEWCNEIINPNRDSYYETEYSEEHYCSYSCAHDAGYVYSEMEGYLISEDDAVEFDGEWYLKGTELSCDNCGELVPVEDMKIDHDGNRICRECYENEEQREMMTAAY